MTRHTRYQGAIVREHHILLLSHREHQTGHTYWVLPGGGIDPDENEEDCVRREMLEETGLSVRIERLLLDEPGLPGGVYAWFKTYLCTILAGEATPGYEPEPEAAAAYRIDQLAWLDLRDPSAWAPAVVSNPFTYPGLLRVRATLGYGKPPTGQE